MVNKLFLLTKYNYNLGYVQTPYKQLKVSGLRLFFQEILVLKLTLYILKKTSGSPRITPVTQVDAITM